MLFGVRDPEVVFQHEHKVWIIINKIMSQINTDCDLTEAEKQALEKERLGRVFEAMRRLDTEIRERILEMTRRLETNAIIRLFNQNASDLFSLIKSLTKDNTNPEIYNLSAYQNLFATAIKLKASFPIDKFSVLVLEYVNEIYARDEKLFLDMEVPVTKVAIGSNEFGFIKTQMFKDLWTSLDAKNKDLVYNKITSMTTFAHSYFYRMSGQADLQKAKSH